MLILCYHGLSSNDEHKWRPDLYISADQFRQRLDCLKRIGASVLPLGEAITRLRERSLPPQSVAITFDDGFRDLLTVGVPALQRYNWPVTLYLTTHYCFHRFPVITLVLDYVLWKTAERTIVLPEYDIPEPLPLGGYGNRLIASRKIQQYMASRNMGTAAKDELARELADKLGVDYCDILKRKIVQVLSPEEVGRAAKSGIDIQLHTHRHRTPADRDAFVGEIIENRDRIEDLTGKMPVHFCYPSGNYFADLVPWLKECDVETATTCDGGLAYPTSDLMRLPRLLDDSGMDLLRFESAVAGILV